MFIVWYPCVIYDLLVCICYTNFYDLYVCRLFRKSKGWQESKLETSSNEFDLQIGFSQGYKNKYGGPQMPCIICHNKLCSITGRACVYMVTIYQIFEKQADSRTLVKPFDCIFCHHNPDCIKILQQIEELSVIMTDCSVFNTVFWCL